MGPAHAVQGTERFFYTGGRGVVNPSGLQYTLVNRRFIYKEHTSTHARGTDPIHRRFMYKEHTSTHAQKGNYVNTSPVHRVNLRPGLDGSTS